MAGPTLRRTRFLFLTIPVVGLTLLALACGGGGGGGGGGNGGDVTVPAVVSTSPVDGATGVPNTSAVVLNFTEAMNTTSVATGVSIASHAGTRTFTWAVGNTRATITFDPLLAEDTHYVVTIDSDVTDAQGTSLAAAYSFSFDTGSVPVATINSPADGATNVSTSPTINITFTEDMDNGSVEDNFGVAGYAGTLSYTWNSETDLDITFDTALDVDTTYTATLLPFAEDAQGTPLGVPSQVTFSTGAALATGAISGVIDDDPDSNYDNNLENTIMALFGHDFTSTEGPPPVLASADAGGAYHFSFLEDGDYWVLALQDTNGDGEVGGDKFAEAGDSIGVWPDVSTMTIQAVTISGGGQSTGISFDLLDTEGISGNVTYAGSDTATAYSSVSTVFVGAFTDLDFSAGPAYGTAVNTDRDEDFDGDTNVWNYAINAFFESPGGQRMLSDNYYVGAFIDLDNDSSFDADRNNDGDFDDGEPAGVFASTVPILQTGQDAVGINIVTYDTVMLYGQVDSITDTTNMDGSPYEGAAVTLLGYPLMAASDSSGAFTMPYAPVSVNAAFHAEPASGSSLLPWNTQYMVIDANLAKMSGGGDGVRLNLISPEVLSFIGDICNVNVDTTKAHIVGSYNVTGGEVLFADGTVKYVDSQFNCDLTANQEAVDGPSFFIFNVDDTLFTDNKGDISGTFGFIDATETVPVRGGELTWVELID